MSSRKTISSDKNAQIKFLEGVPCARTKTDKEPAISRRAFVALTGAGLSAGAWLASPKSLNANAEAAAGETLSQSAVNDASPEPEQVLSPVPDFIPDWTFQGSSLSDWQTLGNATWKAEDGVIVGTPTQSGGGWLILNKPFQDAELFARIRSAGEYNLGVLLRVEKSATGMSGIFVSLREGDLKSYRLMLDANGQQVQREALPIASSEARFAFSSPQPEIPQTPIIAEGEGGRGAQAPAGPGPALMRGIHLPASLAQLQPPPDGIWKDKWNDVKVIYDADIVRPFLNGTSWQMDAGVTNDASQYGPIALYVGGLAPVQFKDLSYRDLRLRKIEPEKVSPNFRKQCLDEFYYSWGVAVADMNHDGHLDVVAGPYYYLGPDFTERREIYLAESFGPSREYAPNMVTHAYDFHGNGWSDVLATEMRAMVLYVNPQDERRRWKRYPAVPNISSEITVLEDIDGDGRPELIYVYQNTVMYAKYDPSDPSKLWDVHQVSEPGLGFLHGLGVGEIQGNGTKAILGPAGWWEPPAKESGQKLWIYHPAAFGREYGPGFVGGAQMYAYDVNGDGLNDVVTSLGAHAWGLAWYEQKRDSRGNISFERHMIMDNCSTRNAGGVTFSELHALTIGDVDGDGVPDIITGRRYWSHLDSYGDPGGYDSAVLYCYHTVRDSKAPGGARFVPELIHNRSGVGSQVAAADLNNDGAIEIITPTDRGNFIFWGTPRNKRM